MNEIDWTDIDERHLKVRRRYIAEHGVSERTIRNYLRRYRQGGAGALLFYSKATSITRKPPPAAP